MLKPIPFVGPSNSTRSKVHDAQRTVNLYLENASGASRSRQALIGTPGLEVWTTMPKSPIRGFMRFNVDTLCVVAGDTFYTVSKTKVITPIGVIDSLTGPVSMASNGQSVAVATGGLLRFVNMATNAITASTYSSDRVGFLDGRFVFNENGTGRFRITGLYDTTIDDLDFATAEGSPDGIGSLLVDHRELWLFGANSTEVWFNSGAADFPIERNQGAFIEVGCAARFGVAKLDSTVYWLAQDDNGAGMVVKANGYNEQRISTHAVERSIASMPRIDDCIAFTYQQEGHSFLVFTFPTADLTWCYDAATGEWHERDWTDAEGVSHRHRAQCHAAFAGLNLVGDHSNGLIYSLSLDAYTDNLSVIRRVRASQSIGGAQMLRHYALQIDMETGVGTESGQGMTPKAMLRWSDNHGQSFDNEVWADIGAIGEDTSRVIFNRLGSSRVRVYELVISDPVRVCITGAYLDAKACRA